MQGIGKAIKLVKREDTENEERKTQALLVSLVF